MTNPSDVTRPGEVEATTYLEFSQNGSPPPLDINGFEGHPIPLANGTSSGVHSAENVRASSALDAALSAAGDIAP